MSEPAKACLRLAGLSLIGSLAVTGAASAQDQKYVFHVPVHLEKMIGHLWRIRCVLRDAAGETLHEEHAVVTSTWHDIHMGNEDSWDGVAVVSATLPPEKASRADSYYCWMADTHPTMPVLSSSNTGPDPTPDITLQGRPDKFFRVEVSGKLNAPPPTAAGGFKAPSLPPPVHP
jgi:hypothetical protein